MRLNARVVVSLCGVFFVGASLGAEWEVIEHKVPPPGTKVDAGVLRALVGKVEGIEGRVEALRGKVDDALLVDVEVFAKALRWAVDDGEFWDRKGYGIGAAGPVVEEAVRRLSALERGQSPWVGARGLVVRGYRSPVDGSVQPYGLEIPEGLDLGGRVPLYVWLHGRGDMKTDLHFIAERLSKPGKLPVKDGIVLHPFGRQCIGWKSAGEVDVFDAIGSVKRRYPIDTDRVVMAGFSMGGAGAWHIGAHYADRFCAVHAGAGFVDVKRYQKLKEETYPPGYTQKLWGVYDVPGYVRNLFNTTTIAYSGENDKQRDAAEYMSEAFGWHGRELTHVIGPGVEHKYEERALGEVMGLLGGAVARGRERWPREVHLQTKTLRYNRMHWVEIERMGEHWREARVDAVWDGANRIKLETENVRLLRLTVPDEAMTDFGRGLDIVWGGSEMRLERPGKTVLLERYFEYRGKDERGKTRHRIGTEPPEVWEGELKRVLQEIDEVFGVVSDWDSWEETSRSLWDSRIRNTTNRFMNRKRPGLQGPIDDAFLGPFLVVEPTGEAMNETVGRWVDFEFEHFKHRWRVLYRGDVRVKKDVDVTPEDVERYHLILWGDPSSNALIKQWTKNERLVGWDKQWVTVGTTRWHAENHVPVMVRLNPMNRDRYVVINSGPTHREAHDRTNSLQNPKLPDWAVLKVDGAPTGEWAGEVVGADFFGERWEVK